MLQATQPVVPSPVPAASVIPPTQPTSTLSPQDSEQAQKYCRFAASALQYEDVKTAIDNLHKALALLEKWALRGWRLKGKGKGEYSHARTRWMCEEEGI